MELAGYLKYLLYNNDSVTIPGIGIMQTLYKHAEINHHEKTIAPPSKYLTFSSQLKKSDSLLVNYITQSLHLKKKEAETLLNQMINEFLEKLNSGETVLLEGIGYFSKTGDTIRFEKESDLNFLTDSFGLSKIDYSPLQPEIELESDVTPVVYIKKESKIKGYVIAFGFLLVCSASIFIYLRHPEFFHFIKRDQVTTRPPISLLPDTSNVSKTDTSTKKSIDEYFDSATDKKNALAIPEKQAVVAEEPMKYYIIAGSFKTIQKATELAKDIENDGYKLKIIKFEEAKIRISLGEYSNLDSAMTDLLKIRNQKGDNSVWLLKLKAKDAPVQ